MLNQEAVKKWREKQGLFEGVNLIDNGVTLDGFAAKYASHCFQTLAAALKKTRPDIAQELIEWWKVYSGKELMEAMRGLAPCDYGGNHTQADCTCDPHAE